MTRRTFPSALLLTLIALVAGARTADAQHQRIITDASSPAVIIPQPLSTRVHVLTAGVDAGFDRILHRDSGDVAPRWFVIDSETRTIIDSATFDAFFNSYPIRVGFDANAGRLYAAQDGRIRAYDIGSLSLLDDTVAQGDYSGVSFDAFSGLIIAHMRTGFTTEGYIVGLVPQTGDTAGVYHVGVNPQMSVAEFDPGNRGIAMYTLSEGSFGTPNAMLSYAGGNPDVYNAMYGRTIGRGISDLTSFPNNATIHAAVVARASNRAVIIDTRTHREIGSFAIPAPISVGADMFRREVYVGTAGGFLYRIDNGGITMGDSIALPGAAGAIAVRDGIVAVAITHSDSAMTVPAQSIVLLNTSTRQIVDTVDVGSQPRSIFFDSRGDLHVLLAATGGTTPWIRLDATTFEAAGTRSVSGMSDHTSVAYDAVTDSVFFVRLEPTSGRMVVAAASYASPDASRVFYNDSTASGELIDVRIGPDGTVLVLERARVAGASAYLHVVRISDGFRVVKAITGGNPIAAAPTALAARGSYGVYVVSEPGTGAMLGQVGFKQNLLGFDTLGRGANHLFVSATAGPAAVTMNGGHELVIVDLAAGAVRSRLPTRTEGFDGPREAIEIVGSFEPAYAVTTYAGDVRFVDANGPYRTEPTGGKAEGIARVGDVFYVASAFTPTYGADSAVVVIGLVSSVESDAEVRAQLSQNAPNPASDRTRVRIGVTSASHVTLEIRTVTGELVATSLSAVMEAGAYDIDLQVGGLAPGAYMYTLRTGSSVSSRIMQVTR